MKSKINFTNDKKITAHHVLMCLFISTYFKASRNHLLRTENTSETFSKSHYEATKSRISWWRKKANAERKKAKKKRWKKNRDDDEGSVEAENCERFLTFFNVTHTGRPVTEDITQLCWVRVGSWLALINSSASMEWWTGSPHPTRTSGKPSC